MTRIGVLGSGQVGQTLAQGLNKHGYDVRIASRTPAKLADFSKKSGIATGTFADQIAARGIYLPRTAFTYLNLGPTRQKGVEASIDERVSSSVSAFANYSWQGDPEILADPHPFPVSELSLPPTNRFNVGASYSDKRWLGALTLNYTDKALWTDVLTSAYHGFTPAFTLVNGSFGVKWMDGKVTTSIKSNNILNKTVQQHVFGDLLRRSVVGELRLDF